MKIFDLDVIPKEKGIPDIDPEDIYDDYDEEYTCYN